MHIWTAKPTIDLVGRISGTRRGSDGCRWGLIRTGIDAIPGIRMTTDISKRISELVIPVYVVTDAAPCPLLAEDALEYVFGEIGRTGGTVRLANIVTFGG